MTVISMRENQSSWLSVVCKMPSKKISSYLPKFFSFQFYVGVMHGHGMKHLLFEFFSNETTDFQKDWANLSEVSVNQLWPLD